MNHTTRRFTRPDRAVVSQAHLFPLAGQTPGKTRSMLRSVSCQWVCSKTLEQTWRSLTMRAPCTPLPRRFGAYSARSTDLSHSITLWLDHWTTSEGEPLLCWRNQRSWRRCSQYCHCTFTTSALSSDKAVAPPLPQRAVFLPWILKYCSGSRWNPVHWLHQVV